MQRKTMITRSVNERVVIRMLERVKAEANQWVRQLGSDLKFALSQLARFLLGGVKLPRFIWHQVRRREIRKEVVHAALFLVVLHLAWAALLVWKDGWAAAIFLVASRWLLPAWLAAAVVAGVFGVDQRGFRLVAMLTTAGMATQIVLDSSNTAQLILHTCVAMVMAVLGAMSYFWLASLEAASMIRLVNALSVGMYLLLLAQPPSHGTRAWLTIGGSSFQLTEAERLLAMIAAVRAATDREQPDREKTMTVFKILALHSMGLALCNEFGTLALIWINCILVLFLSVHQLRWAGIGLGFAGLALYAGVLVTKLCFQIGFKPGAIIYRKICDRLLGSGDGFQSSAAAKGILLSGWFGNDSRVFIPAAQNDMVLVSIAQIWGMLGLFLVLLLFAGLVLWGIAAAGRAGANFPCVLAFACTAQLGAQLAVNAVSAFALGPIVGVGSPFLALGGSALASTYFTVGAALVGSGDLKAVEARHYLER